MINFGHWMLSVKLSVLGWCSSLTNGVHNIIWEQLWWIALSAPVQEFSEINQMIRQGCVSRKRAFTMDGDVMMSSACDSPSKRACPENGSSPDVLLKRLQDVVSERQSHWCSSISLLNILYNQEWQRLIRSAQPTHNRLHHTDLQLCIN